MLSRTFKAPITHGHYSLFSQTQSEDEASKFLGQHEVWGGVEHSAELGPLSVYTFQYRICG